MLRTFPENVFNLDGLNAFPKRKGGILYLLKVQMEDFNEFNRLWFIEEFKKELEKDLPPVKAISEEDL